MSDSTLPAIAPTRDPDTDAFWDATTEGRLLLRRCLACSTVIWYPRPLCPACGSFDTEWFEAAGTGSVYSYTICHRGDGPWREATPYVVAYVELDEGPRMITNIVDWQDSQLDVGSRVEVVFADTGEGAALPRFRPRPGAPG